MPSTLPPLTIIVATTPSLGIGLRGTLPWPALKADLAYFVRVTKRVPARLQHDSITDNGVSYKNAVIMGRKTWDSIPDRFRPLKGRINVIISRESNIYNSSSHAGDHVLGAGSIQDALQKLRDIYDSPDRETKTKLGRVFVIGGAEIYKMAMQMVQVNRILWTRVRTEFECDTFFPAGALPSDRGQDAQSNWREASRDDLVSWTGEDSAEIGRLQREGDLEFEMKMLERPNSD